MFLLACSTEIGDAPICSSAEIEMRIESPPLSDEVDVLLVIDGSMPSAEIVARLPDALRPAFESLLVGDRSVPPYAVNVAVIDMDLGVGIVSGDPSCTASGDTARLHTSGVGCDVSARWPDGVVRFAHDGLHDPTAALDDVACLVAVGASGCRYARGFDTITRALASSEVLFAPNPNAVLALVVITQQDDCSALDENFYADDTVLGNVPPAVRCNAFASDLRDANEVADAILASRRSPSLVFLSVLAGIPLALSPPPGFETTSAPLTAIAADPAMEGTVEPLVRDRLLPVCSSAMGTAAPAVRWVALARALEDHGAGVWVQSVCAADLTSAFVGNAFTGGVGRSFEVVLPHPLDVGADDRVACDVLEALSGVRVDDRLPTRCAWTDHADALTVDHIETVALADGSTRTYDVCRIRQIGRAGAEAFERGWFYDDGTLAGASALASRFEQAIHLAGIVPTPSSEVRIRCEEHVTRECE
jgi:hypothetical protein